MTNGIGAEADGHGELSVEPAGPGLVVPVARKLIQEATDRAAAFRNAVRPIYGATEDGRPLHIGSSVLLEIGGETFILTAAHVIDWAKETQLYLGLAAAELLPATFITSPAPSGRDNDVVDYAIARLPAELHSRLGDATIIPEQMIGLGSEPEKRTFTCIGFPNSKNRTPPRISKIIQPIRRSYTGMGRPVSQLPGRAIEGTNVLVNFDAKFSRDNDGQRVNSGNPAGMSGCAIFDVGRLAAVENIISPEAPRLAAILIEGHRKEQVIVGTRLDAIIADLRSRSFL